MKKKNGFTLIELLAVIVILSVLLIISVPKLIGEIKGNKADALDNYKGMIVSAARNYVIDYNLDTPATITLTTLCDLEYIECPIVNPVNDNNMNGYVNIDSDKNYSYSEDTPLYAATFDINLNLDGGYTTQTIHTGYIEGERIDLVIPSKAGYTFGSWSAGCGSCLSGNTYTVTSSNDTITANWIIYPTLTVNLVGGSTTQTFSARYAPGSNLALVAPTKSGSVFDGWSASGTNASVNGSILTMGSANTTLTASWLLFANMFTYTGSYQIEDDTSSNWRIKFLTNGTFTPLRNMLIDIFLVGGGGGGGNITAATSAAGGGAGGYTSTITSISLYSGSNYSIVIGAGGGSASAGGSTSFNSTYSVNGGGSAVGLVYGGVGGSGGGGGGNSYNIGGTGGSNGSNGGNASTYTGGAGQGTTTREFGDASGTLYAGGGGGGGVVNAAAGAGGAGGGAAGGAVWTNGNSASANTGGGGGGAAQSNYTAYGGSGGSGIVVIRNHR